jgi:hypothetical protein
MGLINCEWDLLRGPPALAASLENGCRILLRIAAEAARSTVQINAKSTPEFFRMRVDLLHYLRF